MARFPRTFSALYRGLVAAGSETGRLPEVLARLADYLEARTALRQKFTTALIYPVLVTVIALAVIVVLLTYVVPQVVSVYQQSRQTLPWLTQALIATSDFFRATAWLWLGLIVATVIAFALAYRRVAFRTRVHAWMLHVPGIGKLLRSLDTARLTRIVGAWAVVFTIFVIAFVANYRVLPYFDHRYRAALFPGDRLGAALTARFHDATGAPLRYVIGTMWDGGNLAHYSPDQPEVLIDGLPRRAPWIDVDDLRDKGAMLVWTQSDRRQVPAAFAAIAPSAEIGTPFDLPMRRNDGVVHVGWAILKPR